MEKHLQTYMARKAYEEAESCLKAVSYNWETVSGRIRNGLRRIPSIKLYAEKSNIRVAFDERGFFKGIDIKAANKAYPYPFSDSEKISNVHWKRKHGMLNEIVEYCVAVIFAAGKVSA